MHSWPLRCSPMMHAVVVPEGSHEDLDCRGPRPSAVQAKSRQGKKDDFPASEVARHLRNCTSAERSIRRPV